MRTGWTWPFRMNCEARNRELHKPDKTFASFRPGSAYGMRDAADIVGYSPASISPHLCYAGAVWFGWTDLHPKFQKWDLTGIQPIPIIPPSLSQRWLKDWLP